MSEANIPTKNPATLKEWLDGLPAAEKGRAFEQVLAEMKISKSSDSYPLCGGMKKAGQTTFTVDLGFGVVVVRNVLATVCSQCGADWIQDPVAAKLADIVNEARRKHLTVEVTTMSE